MATEIVLFDGAPGGAFAASAALLVAGERLTLDFDLVVPVGGGPATMEWFLEFTSDNPLSATAKWAREVAEEDAGSGVVHMPLVVRDFLGLADNTTTRRTAQFIRTHRYARVQLRTSAGTLSRVTIRAPFGAAVI